VATNVLGHGTGALNIDGCRVGTNDTYAYPSGPGGCKAGEFHYQGRADTPAQSHPKGRWPANVVHDGSDEVLEAFARFGESKSQRATLTSKPGDIYGGGAGLPSHTGEYGANDFGTAARFFYSAKADATDRLGSKHPTVKPVDLMRWLVRLVTPPGGTVLDPFAGTGTTGMAALAEGMKAILIEREAEYFEDIKLRMGHVSGADTPLFAEPCDGEGGA
jgi:site-specific DNA-methyltransferase (adenine-specific)